MLLKKPVVYALAACLALSGCATMENNDFSNYQYIDPSIYGNGGSSGTAAAAAVAAIGFLIYKASKNNQQNSNPVDPTRSGVEANFRLVSKDLRAEIADYFTKSQASLPQKMGPQETLIDLIIKPMELAFMYKIDGEWNSDHVAKVNGVSNESIISRACFNIFSRKIIDEGVTWRTVYSDKYYSEKINIPVDKNVCLAFASNK